MSANFSNAFNSLIGTLLDLYLGTLMLRVLLQWVGAEFYNPFSQFVWRLTNPPVRPLASFIPRWRRLDVAGCIVLFVYTVASLYVSSWLWNQSLAIVQALWWSVIKIFWVALNIYTLTLLIQALLSWFGPGVNSAGASALWTLNEPLLRPVRRVIPPVSGFDLSPLAVMLVLHFIAQLLPLPGWLQ